MSDRASPLSRKSIRPWVGSKSLQAVLGPGDQPLDIGPAVVGRERVGPAHLHLELLAIDVQELLEHVVVEQETPLGVSGLSTCGEVVLAGIGRQRSVSDPSTERGHDRPVALLGFRIDIALGQLALEGIEGVARPKGRVGGWDRLVTNRSGEPIGEGTGDGGFDGRPARPVNPAYRPSWPDLVPRDLPGIFVASGAEGRIMSVVVKASDPMGGPGSC